MKLKMTMIGRLTHLNILMNAYDDGRKLTLDEAADRMEISHKRAALIAKLEAENAKRNA